MATIIRLSSSNVKKLKAVEVRPEGEAVVIIRGENEQGKSSLLDSIVYALAGKGSHPRQVIREGEYSATIELETEDLIVLRRWTKKPAIDGVEEEITTELEVRARDGGKLKSPQAVLDALVGDLAFDPLEFSRMKAKEQLELVKKLSGVDTDGIEAKRAHSFDQRTTVNRDLASATARLHAMPSTKPPPRVDVAALQNEANKERQLISNLSAADADWKAAMRSYTDRQAEVDNMKAAMAAAEARLVAARLAAGASDNAREAAQEAAAEAPARIAELTLQITAAGETAAAIARWEDRARVETEVKALTARWAFLNAEIAGFDNAKTELLAAAKFPVAGLGFSADGVTLNGLPLEQASSAGQIRVAVAIAIARNPKLRVFFVREGSLLGANSLELLRQLAVEHQAQIWLEAVGESGPATVVIRDGEAVAA